MGLEPTTFAVTGRRCNQLNYAPAYYFNYKSASSSIFVTLLHFKNEINPFPKKCLSNDRILTLFVFFREYRLHASYDVIVNFLNVFFFGQPVVKHRMNVNGR